MLQTAREQRLQENQAELALVRHELAVIKALARCAPEFGIDDDELINMNYDIKKLESLAQGIQHDILRDRLHLAVMSDRIEAAQRQR